MQERAKNAWQSFRRQPKWAQVLGWIGVGILVLAIPSAFVPTEEEGSGKRKVEKKQSAEEKAEEQSESKTQTQRAERKPAKPRVLSAEQTVSEIYDRSVWCNTYGLPGEREAFESAYESTFEDKDIKPASVSASFRHMREYCEARLPGKGRSLSAEDTATRVYGDATDWCAAYVLAGGGTDRRASFRKAYKLAVQDLVSDGYKPASADAVFDVLVSRC